MFTGLQTVVYGVADIAKAIELVRPGARRAERDLSELLGLAKGLLADGEVTEREAAMVREWVEAHPDAVEQWPVSILHGRLRQLYSDGRVDDTERADLAELLGSLVGGQAGIIVGEDAATELPVDVPPPMFKWSGSVFVFTGKFAFGPRTECERHVIRLGGACESTITKQTNYLVIGTFGSRDWVHTSFGRKIEKAVEYRSAGQQLAIVSEDHWATCI
ncbi:MAG: BRCT domain-containing protein [Candidatus Manganitrophaceae bacterium]